MNNPVIELYEYQIHKYQPIDRFNRDPTDTPKVFKFSDIDDSPVDDCKRVAIDGMQTDTDSDTNRSSCDPIYTQSGGKAYYNIDNLYGNYKLFLAKDTEVNELDDESKKKVLDNLTNVIDLQYKILDNYNHPSMVILFSIINYIRSKPKFDKKDSEDLSSFADESALIQTLNVNDESKIILFGDFHGSYHTFFRHLCRLHRYGIIDLNTFKINDPYKIIFLGDILDRGMYSLDILNVLFKLMLNNNTEEEQKIIFNRGNHENYDQYLFNYMSGKFTSHTSANEFNTKLNDKKIMDEFIAKFNLLLCILPSAVIINNQEKFKYWCSHGGFSIDFSISDDIFILIKDAQMAKDIRWSDFGHIDNGLAFGPSPRDGSSGKMKTYTYKGTMDFLDKNELDFIIRGHQDSHANSALCSNHSQFLNLASPEFPEIQNIILYNDSSKYFGNRVLGPIARLNPDKDEYDSEVVSDVKLFPVLTISTNTDNGRDLNADSFALLRFDIQPTDINNFDKNILSILHNVKDALRNENINKDIIIKKNLETIIKFLSIFNDEINLKLCKITILDKNRIKNENILEINTNILSLYYEISEILEYYTDKITSLKTKIDKLIFDNRLVSQQKDLLIIFIKELIEKSKECIEMLNKLRNANSHKISDEELKNIIDNNTQDKILEKLNNIMKEIIM
jgi:hypothetical protein